MQNPGIFYSLLNRVGASGVYQNISLVLWCITFFTVGATTFYNAFLFHSDDYICPQLTTEDCKEFVCSLPAAQRAQYVSGDFTSLATEFGDYRCDHTQLNSIEFLIYLGGFLGLLFGSYLNGIFPKKKIVVLTLGMSVMGLTLAIAVDSLLFAGIGLMINFASRCIQSQIVLCCISESSS